MSAEDGSSFQPGDHIQRRRFGYDHHAIFVQWDVAPEAYIIHHPIGRRANPLRGKIRHEVRNVFEYTLVQRPNEPDEVLQRAMSRVGDDGYNLVWNNCEHFAEWCVTGKHRSLQVLGAFIGAPQGACIGGAVGAALVPAATFWGSRTLGKWAIWLGLISAPVKWPFVVTGILVAALWFLTAWCCADAVVQLAKPSANQSVGEIVQEAAEGNLKQLQTELAKLQKGLRYAKTYLSDSKEELANLTAEVAKSNLSQELKVAEAKYQVLHDKAEEATSQENRVWKKTLKSQESMDQAKKKYRRAMQQLEVNEAALKTKAARLANATNSSHQAALPHSGVSGRFGDGAFPQLFLLGALGFGIL